MDSDTSQLSPEPRPVRNKTWITRLIGAGVVLVCLLLLASLLTYDINEMGWGFLNTRNPEAASAAPCTNILGLIGLYISGLLYYFLGAAAPYGLILCAIVGGGYAWKPEIPRKIQWINLGVMLLTACAFLGIQNLILTEWAEEGCLRGPGGSMGYLFGTCIVEALIGPVYSAIFFLLAHAVALIYFARLTPRQVGRALLDDLKRIWAAWTAFRARKRKEKELIARSWKEATDAQDEPVLPAANRPAPAGAPAETGVPRQMPLPIHTEDTPAGRAPSPQAPEDNTPAPAPQAPVPPRKRPPLVIPPRPDDSELEARRQAILHPEMQPARQPEPAVRPAAPAEQTPVRTQEPEPRPAPAPAPRPVAPARQPQRRNETPLPLSHGDNFLDLMQGIEDDIERDSYSGKGLNSTAVPNVTVRINPRLQAAVNRHLGIVEEPEPEPQPEPQPQPRVQPKPQEPAAPAARPEHHYEPVRKPAPAPAPAPVDEYNGMYMDYPFPPYELLNYTPPSPEVAMAAEEEAYQMQQCLIDTFSNFNITMEPGEITRGPSLTRYEFYPPKGMRLNRIANLKNDLMLATQTKAVNILAPIPGKNTVGVELENATKESVYLRELLESPAFHNPKLKIPVALGKNVYGEPVIGDLAAMPHALVAGTTGSGKSVCINSMILSMLYKFRPDELRLVLVDPKVVEMQPYRKLPHLACPVVTNPARVIGALRWAVNEMEHRYSMFSKIGVRNFEDFNNRPEGYVPEPEEEEEPMDELPINTSAVDAIVSDIERSAGEDIPEEEEQGELDFEADEQIPAKLPYIVIIIDELADLMMVVKEDLENYIARLTQKARAAGIHLVAATQTPRSNVVTGLIKANIPCRIALKVASPLDSRIILDTNGAENLLGRGDLLFLPPGGITKLTRAQGAWVSDAEIASIIKFCASHAKQKFDQNVTAEMNNADGSGAGGPGSDGENGRLAGSGGNNEDDELYTRCVNLVVTERKASTSLLQRRFSIGYGRAAKIMDMMEERGVISPAQGPSRAREVLVEAPE